MKYLYLFSIVFLFGACKSTQIWNASQVPVYSKFDSYSPKLVLENDSIHVINFWATWCKPCVAELPYFEESLSSLQKEKIKFTYVSLDFEKNLRSKVIPFLNTSKIKADVVLLSDGKYNDWIDKVDPSWSGSIPATLITLGEKNIFFEGSFHSEQEIIDLIHKIKI